VTKAVGVFGFRAPLQLLKHCIVVKKKQSGRLTDNGIKFLSGDTDSDFFRSSR
jgi:hypothetical protein